MRQRMSALYGAVGWKKAWGGALLGVVACLLIVATLQPTSLSFLNHSYQEYRAPGDQRPSLAVDVGRRDVSYAPGTEVSDFGGLSWRSSYEVYHVRVENTGSRPVRDLRAVVPLPGCSEFVNEEGPTVGGDYRTGNVVDSDLPADARDRDGKRAYDCSKLVSADGLAPGEVIAVEFVTVDEFDRCDLLIGLHPTPEVVVGYDWERSGTSVRDVESTTFAELAGEYADLRDGNDVASATYGVVQDREFGVGVVSETAGYENAARKCGWDL